MKLVTFLVNSPFGPIERIGALLGDDVIDIASAYECLLIREHVFEARAVSEGLIPPDMRAFLGRCPAAMQAAEKAMAFVSETRRGGSDVMPEIGRSVRFGPGRYSLRSAVRPARIKDYLTFEAHKKSAMARRGQTVPELWYQVPSYSNRNVLGIGHPNDDIIWPHYSKKLDFEFEIGLIVGRMGKDIRAEDASSYIAGFTIYNDFSARDIQANERIIGSGPGKSKDFDQGNIIGPCIATPDEVDGANIKMILRVNGEKWAEGSTAGMKHSWGKIVENASRGETIYPGDLLASGTMDGGCCVEADRWFEPGAEIEMEAVGIGILRNRVVGPKQ